MNNTTLRWVREFPESAHPDEKPYYVVDLGGDLFGEVDETPDGSYTIYLGGMCDDSIHLGEISAEIPVGEVLHVAAVLLSCYLDRVGRKHLKAADDILEAEYVDVGETRE